MYRIGDRVWRRRGHRGREIGTVVKKYRQGNLKNTYVTEMYLDSGNVIGVLEENSLSPADDLDPVNRGDLLDVQDR